jgi:hypothetical protein
MKRYGKLVFIPAATIAVFVAAFFSACSPANRLSRLLARHPGLANVQVDSVFIPGEVKTDTVQTFSTDTIIAGADTFICRTDTFRIIQRCKPGTIAKSKTVNIPVNKGTKTTKEPKRPVREKPEKVKRLTLGERIDKFFTYIFIFIVGYAAGSIMSLISRRK